MSLMELLILVERDRLVRLSNTFIYFSFGTAQFYDASSGGLDRVIFGTIRFVGRIPFEDGQMAALEPALRRVLWASYRFVYQSSFGAFPLLVAAPTKQFLDWIQLEGGLQSVSFQVSLIPPFLSSSYDALSRSLRIGDIAEFGVGSKLSFPSIFVRGFSCLWLQWIDWLWLSNVSFSSLERELDALPWSRYASQLQQSLLSDG